MFKHEWKIGDRAKVVLDVYEGIHYGNLGETFTVIGLEWIDDKLQLRGDKREGRWAVRCKPVYRVQAKSQPTPRTKAEEIIYKTYAELRTAHGPSRYQTGHDVFRGWGPARTVPKYEEIGN